MILTQEQNQQMLEASRPLMRWMNENCNPYCVVRVDQSTVELTEGIAMNRTNEYLHKSDCSKHNAPALPVGTCDCRG